MNYVIIGASAAGISAIESIRETDKNGKITIVSDEDYPIYSRCLLSYYLAGTISEEKLKYRDDDFYKKNNVNAILGKKVELVLPDKKVKLSDSTIVPFDKLLIATGSRSKTEKIPGVQLEGVLGLRNIEDAKKIEVRLDKTKTAVMLGGGLIGLRAAYALHKRGVKVTVVVKSKHVLSQILDEEGASFIQKEMEKQGIKILTGLSATEIVGNKDVNGVVLENGEKIDCEIVVIGKGVQANTELVKGTDIKTERGIIVDDELKTTVSDIYSAGDVAQTSDLITGEKTINALWPNAVIQGKIAGLNMAGKNIKYDGSLAMNSVEFFGLPTISYGITKPKGEGYEFIVKKKYKKFVLKNNKIVGFVLVGDIDNAGVYGSLLRKKIDISSVKNKLLENNFNFAKILPLIKEHKDKFFEKEYDEVFAEQINAVKR
ncbi:MAG: NAD(P)/FAD-dependent oxidoreductase [Elusimicrobia bacterium CG06_land_8_20_14_3_00_38_11]|nr:MAG: NAD(P)/FAD-dependent oxidoreductase [Elusimicrobia bacterium CG06_land_8_20_14_3_00_38_11]